MVLTDCLDETPGSGICEPNSGLYRRGFQVTLLLPDRLLEDRRKRLDQGEGGGHGCRLTVADDD